MVDLPQRFSRFAKKCAPCIGRADDPINAAFDQGNAKLVFQPLHRHRQRWLRHTKAMRGTVKMPFFGDRDELLYFAQVNHPARDATVL